MILGDINTILYTTSLGKHTRPVVRQAVRMAQAFNAKIVMLHVVEPIGEMGSALIRNYVAEEVIKQMHDEGIAHIKQDMIKRIETFYAEELTGLDTPLEIDYQVMEGHHADSILKAISQFSPDLVVMGQENSFGHHSATTQHVVRKSTSPVLVVPTGKQYL